MSHSVCSEGEKVTVKKLAQVSRLIAAATVLVFSVSLTMAAGPGQRNTLPRVTPFGRPASQQPAQANTAPGQIPPFAAVKKTVDSHFKKQKDYLPGDLISSADVARLKAPLTKAGWLPKDWGKISQQLLPPGDFLIRESKTKNGRQFMKQLAGVPNGYDRLDHLRKVPRGETDVRYLMKIRDGYKMIEYMATTPGGKNMGRSLSQTPGGKNFNQPTKRIYTVKDFIAQLETSYKREMAGPNKQGSNKKQTGGQNQRRNRVPNAGQVQIRPARPATPQRRSLPRRPLLKQRPVPTRPGY